MKLTKQWLVKHHACNSGIQAFLSQKETDSIKILKLLIRSKKRENLEWANWLISRLFKTKKQRVQYSVFAARLVLPVFEQEYPEDSRSRKAVEAVENWLKNPSEKSRELCKKAATYVSCSATYYAASAAYYAASYATYAASAAATAATAATAASAAAYLAAYLAASAAYDAYAFTASAAAYDAYAFTASAAAYNKIFIKILKYGMTLL